MGARLFFAHVCIEHKPPPPATYGGTMNSPASTHFAASLRSILLLCLLVLLGPATLFADVTATVSGVVTDHSGAVVPGASVEMTQSETGITRSTKTNGDGFYNLLQ